MTNKEVIERFNLKDWYVTCQNKQESNLVLQACDDAGITWAGGEKATEWCPFGTYPFDICFYNNSHGISADNVNICEAYEMENITDWFFNVIKNNDGNLIPKLTPQNAEQEHWVQIILARLQGVPVEYYSIIYNEWLGANCCSIDINNTTYRIKPTPTPLPISRELWSYIDKRWRFIAIDRSGAMYLFLDKPTAGDGLWLPVGGVYSQCPLNINTDGINWETSLTERPEGV